MDNWKDDFLKICEEREDDFSCTTIVDILNVDDLDEITGFIEQLLSKQKAEILEKLRVKQKPIAENDVMRVWKNGYNEAVGQLEQYKKELNECK